MEEARSRFIPLAGTILLHIAVVAWLAATPEQRAHILNSVEMDVVDLTPEPEEAPEPEAQEEPPPPPPDPPPTKQKRPRRLAKQPPPEQQPEETPEEVPEEVPEQPAPMLDFGEQNLAAPGSGTGWGMKTSNGTSSTGVYRRGVKGATGMGTGDATEPTQERPPTPSFAPVPRSKLSRNPSLIGQISRAYPPEARRQAIEGTVRLLVDIYANGRVHRVRILADPGGGLGSHAAALLRRARFNPALDSNGRAVATRITYNVRYLLDD